MPHRLKVRDRLPDGQLGQLVKGELRRVDIRSAFAGRRAIIVGIPGAFTPVCTGLHIPGFVELAPTLLASGFDKIACLSVNDPWTLSAWSKALDPAGRIEFYSDGNRDFGRGEGLLARNDALFLDGCLERFTLIVSNSIVEKINVEPAAMSVTCSAASQCLAPVG